MRGHGGWRRGGPLWHPGRGPRPRGFRGLRWGCFPWWLGLWVVPWLVLWVLARLLFR